MHSDGEKHLMKTKITRKDLKKSAYKAHKILSKNEVNRGEDLSTLKTLVSKILAGTDSTSA